MSFLQLRNQYVFRCLAATEFEADLFARISTVVAIDTALESLVTCSSGTNRESNVVVLLLGLLLEATEIHERELEVRSSCASIVHWLLTFVETLCRITRIVQCC